eukprot:TRINITY_DN5337_c0_g1_i1.p1 TRINITY_DN5337_c0_g1~~TRINITY_DN5337_c0_g1_i1.p1  ORF type:complete len:265 (-),score=15.00 TRINITY_DN5337_c0_g1_i1:230-1024(-)
MQFFHMFVHLVLFSAGVSALEFELQLSTVGCDPSQRNCSSSSAVQTTCSMELDPLACDYRVLRSVDKRAGVPCEDWEEIECTGERVTKYKGQVNMMPLQFTMLDMLEDLDMADSVLSGLSLPPEFSVMTSLTRFVIHHSDLIGTMPVEYSTWINLMAIDVEDNHLGGQMPPEYTSWTQLNTLMLALNMFSGPLPVEYSEFSGLVTWWNYRCQWSGTLPVEYSTLTNLRFGSFDANQLTGSIPVEYSTLQIDLSGIQVNGEILSL